MTYLLRISVSPRDAASHSRRFADEVAGAMLSLEGIERVVHRDLSRDPLPTIGAEYIGAMLAHRTREESARVPALALSEQLIAELEAARAVLIDTPVHNYTIPAALKTWVDLVVRTGRTFTSTSGGKLGTLVDRPTVVISASGGYFTTGPARQPDFFAPYVTAVLATIGIRNVRHVRLEGVTRGDEALGRAFASARSQLEALKADWQGRTPA